MTTPDERPYLRFAAWSCAHLPAVPARRLAPSPLDQPDPTDDSGLPATVADITDGKD